MRILHVNAKCEDRCGVQLIENGTTVARRYGYVPCNIGLGGVDYIKLEIDADTGQIQNWTAVLAEMMKKEEE